MYTCYNRYWAALLLNMNVDIKAYDVRIYKWKCWSWVRHGGPEVLLNKKLQGEVEEKNDLMKSVLIAVEVTFRLYSLYDHNSDYFLPFTLPSSLPPFLPSSLPPFLSPSHLFSLSYPS